MRVLISGAGIAGLTLAYWLHQDGHDCTLVEKAPDIRTGGYMIDFGGTGWDVADRMGLIPQLEARQLHVPSINFLHRDGSVASALDVPKLYEIAGVAGKFMAINRRDLVAVLYEQVKPYTRFCFDTSIQSIQQTDTDVTVTFADQSLETYDVVVGADGIHSHVRKLIFGDEAQFTNYLGYHFAVFVIPALTDNIPDGYNMYLEPGVQVSVNLLPDRQWMVFIIMQHDRAVTPAPSQRKRYMRERLSHMGWICFDIARAITDNTSIFYDTVTQIINPHWSQGRVVLIGDAAHCPTLVSGQGASMAMAGAYFLSEALAANQSLATAFQLYDMRLRPYIDTIQQKAHDFAPNFVPDSQWRIWLIQNLMKLSDAPFVKSLIGKQFAIESVIPSDATHRVS